MALRTPRLTRVATLAMAALFVVLPHAARAQVAPPVVPTVIPVSGTLQQADGQPRTGTVVLAISLYESRDDVAPRWIEYQTVTLDEAGRYAVQFGATRDDGLPPDLFTGDAATRWIGVAVENEAEQPRVMLLSVPYAARAASAETLGGKTVTEFVLTSNFNDNLRAALDADRLAAGSDLVSPEAVTANYLQKGDALGGTTDSVAYENAGNIGVGTTSPNARLDVAASASDDVSSRGNIVLSSFFGAPYFRFGLDANGGLAIDELFGTPSNVLLANTSGNVAIGGSPAVAGGDRFRVIAPAPRLRLLPTVGGSQLWLGNTVQTWGIEVSEANNNLTVWERAEGNVRLTVQPNGNVGIGTTSPTAKLHVAGSATVTGDVVVAGNIAAKYQDVAEWVDAAEPMESGTLVIIDPRATNRVAPASRSYDSRVAGAVSPQPGLILGEPGDGKALVAQSGRVRVKADARYGAIRPGDLLVTSPTKGHAMRSNPDKVRPGTVVGKALEGLPAGRGEILVLLTLQ